MNGGRWSRARARRRWAEFQVFAGVPLAVGLALMAVQNLVVMISHWADYRYPIVTAAVYVVAMGGVGYLWWAGPRGIGLLTSLTAGVVALGLMLAIALQLTPEGLITSYWMNFWAVAVPAVLAFSRPIEEPIAIAAAALLIDFQLFATADLSAAVRHLAPVAVLGPTALLVGALAVIGALRAGVVTTQRAEAELAAIDRRRVVADAVHHDRLARFTRWVRQVAPLLDDVAAGRLTATDPRVIGGCRALARSMRAQLSAVSDSVLDILLADESAHARELGVELAIRDLEIGHRLLEAQRLEIVELTRQLCRRCMTGSIGLTAVPADPGLGTGTQRALIMISAAGVRRPATAEWTAACAHPEATVIEESPTRWWWDLLVDCEPAGPQRYSSVSPGR